MSVVIIVRGLPGSGKTTWAKAFQAQHPGTVVCSADDAFESDAGYNYNPHMVSAAHFACRVKVERALQAGAPYVVVDNTHTRRWEYEKTLEIARNAHAMVYQYVCTGTWPSVHDIPADKLVMMSQRFESDVFLLHWKDL